MKNPFVTLIVVSVFTATVTLGAEKTSDEDRLKAVHKSNKILSDLYQVLRNTAFPKSPYSVSSTTHNRFILMSPGKVLNYFDYYPGDQYTASLKAKNTSAPHVLVPPSVMEKWFDISDVVVAGNLDAGDTGKSLSQIYENIISQITIKDFKSLYLDAEARYNEAKKYLTEPIRNPTNLAENTTRMGLYSIYQDEYAEARLNMEEKINNARLTKSSIEYELWFRRYYKLLNAEVEDAYSKWLVFGEKELVELYKTFLDTTSAGPALEEARLSLRASGVSSLDRTRTVYPVTFEPSNWYEYLLAKNTPPSRDMLVAKRNLLQSELATLNATVRITAEKQDKAKRTTDALQQKSDIKSQRRDNATRDAVDAQIKCMNKRSTNRDQTSEGQDPCDEYEEEADHAVDATYEQAEASSEYFSANLLLRSEQRFQKFMQSKMSALEQQISELENQLAKLKGSQVYLGAIAESPEFESLNKGSGEAEDKWLKFDYNSDSTHTNTAGNSNSVSVTTGISVPLLVTVNSHYNKDEEEMREAFNSANLQASGELLRVFIKRPWFKPSLFDNPVFNFVSSNFASL